MLTQKQLNEIKKFVSLNKKKSKDKDLINYIETLYDYYKEMENFAKKSNNQKEEAFYRDFSLELLEII